MNTITILMLVYLTQDSTVQVNFFEMPDMQYCTAVKGLLKGEETLEGKLLEAECSEKEPM